MPNPLESAHADPWQDDLFDVETLNEHVTGHLVREIDRVEREATSQAAAPRASSTLVLGTAGAGKTHLFARLRKLRGLRAAFVHVRPQLGSSLTIRQLLTRVVDALDRKAISASYRQIDVVIGALLARADGVARRFPQAALEKYKAHEGREERLEEIAAGLLDDADGLSDRFLRFLLRVPFAKHAERRALLAYLSGRELEDSQAKKLGLRDRMEDGDVLPALRTLARVASLGAPLVLVFDQLENLEDESGQQRILDHAHLYCELHDEVHGLVLASLALDDLWRAKIEPVLPQPTRSRMAATVLTLANPSPEEKDALLRGWVERLPPDRVTGEPPYPFAPAAWQRWRSDGSVTPRMLLCECRAWLDGEREADPPSDIATAAPTPPEEPATLEDRLEAELAQRLGEARAELQDIGRRELSLPPERLRAGLYRYFALLHEGAPIAAGTARDAFDLRVGGGGAPLYVFLLQHTHPKSLAAALKRATAATATGAVAALRESRLALKPGWTACAAHLRELAGAGGRFAWVEHEALARLLALDALLGDANSGDVTDASGMPAPLAAVTTWARALVRTEPWAPVAEWFARSAPPPAGSEPPAPRRTSRPPAPAGLPSAAWTALRSLRIASVDRIVRQVQARDRAASHAAVVADLKARGAEILWFGQSIVCVAEVTR